MIDKIGESVCKITLGSMWKEIRETKKKRNERERRDEKGGHGEFR